MRQARLAKRHISKIGLKKWLMYYLSSERTMQLFFGNYRVTVRPKSRDLEVSHEALYNEYDSLLAVVDTTESGLIVDAGAYIGVSTLRLAKMFPYATIVAIEPHTMNYELLLENTKANSNITRLKCALTGLERDKITLRDRRTGDWGYTVVERPLDVPDARAEEDVETITLPEVVRRFKKEVFFLKMDIEGGETDILTNSAEIISKIPVIFVEAHDRIAPGATEALLKACPNHWIIRGSGEKLIALAKPTLPWNP